MGIWCCSRRRGRSDWKWSRGRLSQAAGRHWRRHREHMIYLLVKLHYAWLESHHFGFLRVFNDVTFQSTAAVILSFALVTALGPSVIRWLRRQKIGDEANFDQAQMDQMMLGKKGT